jgi:hypothetical protein
MINFSQKCNINKANCFPPKIHIFKVENITQPQECGFSTSHASTLRFHSRMHAGNLMKCQVKDCTFQVRA